MTGAKEMPIPLAEDEELVRIDDFITPSGIPATVMVVNCEKTITDSEGVAKCIDKMKKTAANILMRAELRKYE